MIAETVEILEREREIETHVLENKTGLFFVLKIQMYSVKYRTYRNLMMRSFCVLFLENFTSGYV